MRHKKSGYGDGSKYIVIIITILAVLLSKKKNPDSTVGSAVVDPLKYPRHVGGKNGARLES